MHVRSAQHVKRCLSVGSLDIDDGAIAVADMSIVLRAYDPARHSRITFEILRETTVIARMDLAAPMTVDNFEGIASIAGADGQRRFYLVSDDNNRATQRTLLFAFDWQPR